MHKNNLEADQISFLNLKDSNSIVVKEIDIV